MAVGVVLVAVVISVAITRITAATAQVALAAAVVETPVVTAVPQGVEVAVQVIAPPSRSAPCILCANFLSWDLANLLIPR